MFKRIIIGISLLLVLFFAALFMLPSLVPTDTYRTKLETELSRVLARDVSIKGDIDISTFPAIEVNAGVINIANPEDYGRESFIDMNGLKARVKLLPLLSKRVEISRFTLDTPNIWLERQANGMANWSTTQVEKPKTNESFQRDGRYTEYDPALDLLRIKDGSVRYIDAQSKQDITISNITLDLNAPGLDRALKLDGALRFDDLDIVLNGQLETPDKFLNGLSAPLSLNVITDLGKIEAKGAFQEGLSLAFNVDTKVESSDPIGLAARLPLPENVKIPALTSLSSIGQIDFDGDSFAVSGLDFKAAGESIAVKYAGDLNLTETPTAKGAFDISLTDMSIIAENLETPVEGLDALSEVMAKGDLDWTDKGIALPKLSSTLLGPDLSVSFDGSASYTDTISAAGQFESKLGDPAKLAQKFAPDLTQASLLGPTEISGLLNLVDGKANVSSLSATTKGEAITGSFTGDVATTDAGVTASGPFDVVIADMATFTAAAGLEQPDAAALGRVVAKGQLNFTPNSMGIKDLTATATEGLANGSFSGTINSLEPLSLSGRIDTNIADLSALDTTLPRDIPYSDMIGAIGFATNIDTQGQTHNLTDLTTSLSGGQINGNFNGRATISDSQRIDGSLDLQLPNLRTIAEQSGTVLPPNTDKGAIFEALTLAGNVSGTTDAIKFVQGKMNFDKLSGTGDFLLSLTGDRPRLTGDVALSPLDLRPYMAAWSAQRPQGQIVPWSTAPINLSGLKALDAELKLTTPNINLTRLEMGTTNVTATLKQGVMKIDVPTTALYGGNGRATVTLDAPNTTPRLKVDTAIKAVRAKDFFMASGGFDKVEGLADLDLSFTGSGRSQSDIMRSLSGAGDFNVQKGSLIGIDAEVLLTGVDQAIAQRSLPNGLGLGIGKTTNFNDLKGRFTITNGRADLGAFALESGNFFMEGGGIIDMGNQNLDFGIRPKLKAGSDLASFGVPLKFSGGFGQANAGLDTDVLTKIATAKARQSAGDVVKDQIGGSLGGVLGSIIGGESPSPATEPKPSTTPNPESAPTPTKPAPSADETTPKTPDEQVNRLLNDLFGKKKTKKP